MSLPRIQLVHWSAHEAEEPLARLRAAGYEVVHEVHITPATLRVLAVAPPAAMVIDLSRVPSHGRDIGVHVRLTKGTRLVPLIFVGGDPDKVARIRALLPDATYTTWADIQSALDRALSEPVVSPVVPDSVFAPYVGTPLVHKLSIKADASVALLDAPQGFERTVGELPAGAVLYRQPGRPCDLTIWFVTSYTHLQAGITALAAALGSDGLWLAWPKKSSGVATDLNQNVVREAGLAAGLVDYKVCAIDATWSALRFARRGHK